MKTKIAVLVSGGGTNLQALIDAQKSGVLCSGEITLVVSNNADAYALERAKNAGISTAVLLKKELGGQAGFEKALAETLEAHGIQVIILAGFMSILSGDFTKRYPKRILNVHPSLIPAFCGAGFYGLRVHEAALSYGVKVTGATVHLSTRSRTGERSLPKGRWISCPGIPRNACSGGSWSRRSGSCCPELPSRYAPKSRIRRNRE